MCYAVDFESKKSKSEGSKRHSYSDLSSQRTNHVVKSNIARQSVPGAVVHADKRIEGSEEMNDLSQVTFDDLVHPLHSYGQPQYNFPSQTPQETHISQLSPLPSLSQPAQEPIQPVQPVQSVQTVQTVQPVPSFQSTEAVPSLAVPRRDFCEPSSALGIDPILSINQLSPLDEDLKLKADEMSSMNDFFLLTKQSVDSMEYMLSDSMKVDDLILELQRQTVHSMMDEIGNISDILAASQLDMYTSQEVCNPSMMDGVDSGFPSAVLGEGDAP